jgi:hypothetical protein
MDRLQYGEDIQSGNTASRSIMTSRMLSSMTAMGSSPTLERELARRAGLTRKPHKTKISSRLGMTFGSKARLSFFQPGFPLAEANLYAVGADDELGSVDLLCGDPRDTAQRTDGNAIADFGIIPRLDR